MKDKARKHHAAPTHQNNQQKHPGAKQLFTRDAVTSPLWVFLCIWGSLVFWELVVRFTSNIPFWNAGLVFIALYGASLAGLFTAICALLPRRAAYITAGGLLTATGAIYIVQMFYYSIFNTYATTFSILNGTQALQFGETIWGQLAKVWPWVLCMLLPLVAWWAFGLRLPHRRTPAMAGLALALCLLLQFGGTALLPAFGSGLLTPYDYYHNGQSIGPTVNKLGLYTGIRRDVWNLLFSGSSGTPTPPTNKPTSRPSTTPPASSSSTPQTSGGQEEEPPQRVLGPNVLDIDLAALAETEENQTIADIHRYFVGVEPTMQNEYTGLFEGYNLITITAESFAPYAIDPERTPTLYKMMTEGMNFSNFYVPLWDSSTLDGEYAICQGLVPRQGVWSMMITGDQRHTLPFTLGNQFLDQGYATYAYHNHNAEFYNRTVSHPNMGYDFKALNAGLELESAAVWPESDLEMVDVTTAEFIGDGSTPFHVYYLTVSGHQPYEYWNAMSQKNWDTVEDLPLSNQGKAFLACNVELDRALELLLQRLEEAGIADKTVIALTADHPPYPLQAEGMSELAGYYIDYQFEYFRNSFFLYTPGMQPMEVDKPCSSLDILPTLSNLFALPYDSRLLAGRDILSDAQPLVMLANRAWITDRARFDAYNGIVTNLDEENPVDDEYVQRIHQELADRFTYSARILDTDYYAWLFPHASDGG